MIRCGIALAGANKANWPTGRAGSPLPADSPSATDGAHGVTRPTWDVEDGLLTGLEASQLHLQGTELVVLSACDSGTGDIRIGEGVMSLRRAFRIAGAETVLASHWKVSDKATGQLMTEFMRRWRAGEPRAKAWRESQLSLLGSKNYSNPFFWAAFTLTGEWRSRCDGRDALQASRLAMRGEGGDHLPDTANVKGSFRDAGRFSFDRGTERSRS